MISLADVYHVMEATVPLYFAMILAYISVKWLKLFTPEQCLGINKFVAKFSIPLLSFKVISDNNLYKMNLKILYADFLQKLLACFILATAAKLSSRGSLVWVVTGLSVSTLPNTLILGIPLLKAMFGEEAVELLSQIIVLQSLIWYNLLLFLFELNATKESYMIPSSEIEVEQEAPEEAQPKEEGEEEGETRSPRKMKLMHILISVGKKFIANPNTHATLAGLIWASIRFRWGLSLPTIVQKSISILSDGGLGMATFSLGLFMASQASIIPCGTKKAILAMAMKFLGGPILMSASSLAIGARGKLLRIAIVQAALPQGIVPFVFAKEYNVHPDILSTGVIFGMLIALPIALGYYFLLTL
nr:auxin efflux carrier component 8 [Ipomoea batatas]